MIVMMRIHGKAIGDMFAKKRGKRGIIAHGMRMSGTADMMIQANDMVGRRHYEMKIMRDHEDAGSMLFTDIGYQVIQHGLSGNVDALRGFVKHQKFRVG